MASSLTTDQLQQLRELLAAGCGIAVGDAGHPSVQEGIARLMARHEKTGFDEFIAWATNTCTGVRDQLLNAMVSRETAWFRDPECWDALGSEVLAPMEEKLEAGGAGKIRVWSAGCSTGQEPYSFVMSILERIRQMGMGTQFPTYYDVIATDISPAALFLAVAGRYDARAMAQGLSPEHRKRYFTREGAVWCLVDAVRQAVRFRQRNLQDPYEGETAGPFDVVLLRRVLEYYAPETRRRIVGQVAEAMSPGGVLFLGSGETCPEHDKLLPEERGRCTVYRRRG